MFAIVQVEALIERERLQQILAARADVARFEKQVLRDFVLDAKIPLLDIRRFQIAIDGAKLKRLGNVSGGATVGLPRASARDAGVVANHIGAARARSARDAKRQPVTQAAALSAAQRKRCRSARCQKAP